MVFCYPSTPKKLAMTIAFFFSGATIFWLGAHLSYVNVAPQQARIKARRDIVLETFRKKYGYKYQQQAQRMARKDSVIPPQQAQGMTRDDLGK